MNIMSAAFILSAVMATAAVAQTAPQSPTQAPPHYAPPSQIPSQATPGTSPAPSNPRADTQGDVNDCASRTKANNPRLSAVEIKQYCQRQLNPSSPQD